MPFGAAQSLTLGNGVQVANSFDFDYRLSGIQASLGATPLQSLSLTYDPASNVDSIADAVSPSLSQSFQYNLGGHVTRGTGVYGTDNYTYDAMGNRLTRSLVKGTTASTTYTYTSTGTRLASAATGSSTLSYTYDAMGSITARKLGNTTQAAYTYNGDGRLATAAGATYKYNAFGQRSVQTVTGGGNHFIFGPGGLLLAEHAVTGAVQRNYVYLNGRPLAVVDAAGAVSYVLNDHLGQPQKMLNAAGAVTWHRVAGVYGDTASQPVGATAANPQRFPGQQQDSVTGLYYNYFRDYDPATGRYLEADPIGLAGGVNIYGYAKGNPLGYIDPSGLETAVIIGGPISSNPFGHAAIATTGHGVYSAGTGTPTGSNLTAYLNEQSRYRDSTVYILDTTPAQERIIRDYLLKQPNTLPDATSDPLGALEDNCATRVRNALLEAGIKLGLISRNSPFPGDLGLGARALANRQHYIPRGTRIQ
jgi:RHS repeat-associated protein